MTQLPERLAFVDIETTGGNYFGDRIIEIGIVRVENNREVKRYQTLINPDCYVSPFIENLTGITSKDLESAPTFYEVKDEILETLSDCVFVAHNVRFDYGFLRSEFKRYEHTFNAKHFCTVKLSRALFPEYRSHNLDALIERFDLHCQNRHRALDDASMLWDFYQKVRTQFSDEKVLTALNTAVKRPSRPLNISEEVLDALPDSPGIYIFYDKAGAPLYVGKSIHIRERVLSHFSADTVSNREMQLSEETHQIETIVTAGELSALFLESAMVKKLQPLYNRKLRLKRSMMVLKKNTAVEGYDTISLEEVTALQSSDLPQIMGVVKSKKQGLTLLREIAKTHSLCPKLLGIEPSTTSCFSYRLGWCNGACMQKEAPILYNVRFLAAFSEYKIKKWPFNGPIIITEKNDIDEKMSRFVIDSWCYLGNCDEYGNCDLEADYTFDHDTYKILVTYLKSPKNYKNITQISPKDLQTSVHH